MVENSDSPSGAGAPEELQRRLWTPEEDDFADEPLPAQALVRSRLRRNARTDLGTPGELMYLDAVARCELGKACPQCDPGWVAERSTYFACDHRCHGTDTAAAGLLVAPLNQEKLGWLAGYRHPLPYLVLVQCPSGHVRRERILAPHPSRASDAVRAALWSLDGHDVETVGVLLSPAPKRRERSGGRG